MVIYRCAQAFAHLLNRFESAQTIVLTLFLMSFIQFLMGCTNLQRRDIRLKLLPNLGFEHGRSTSHLFAALTCI